ncbi:replicative DNA helicase [Spiroplasma endosymbiont of Labia minor]|uniref:replicative DNA helicase n=1 Tax=Spiroplasma endosymbiont of Labia minor TaxID=3066305 RepID=UPI0030CEC36A
MIENNEMTNSILLNAEAQLLSIAIHSSTAFNEISLQVKTDDFTKQANQIIYKTLFELRDENKDISLTQLADYLNYSNKLNQAGGMVYLSELSSLYYTDEGFENFVQIIFEHSLKRQLTKTVTDIKSWLDSGQSSIMQIFSQAQSSILDIKTDLLSDSMTPISVIADEVLHHIDKLRQNKEIITGVPSGFKDLDNMTAGWQNGDLIILAARPSMGKTAFALNLGFNAAIESLQQGTSKTNGIAFFSLEMPKEQLVQRIFGMQAQINSQTIRTGQVNNSSNQSIANMELMEKLANANETIKRLNIVIDDTPGMTVLQIQSKLRKMKRDYGINLCVIDYLQLISSVNGFGDNRQNEIATISRQLKKVARELNMPIICLSQLSRSVEKREDKKPIMSDLRDSGAIEQDADIIMFLYRQDYYLHDNQLVNEQSDVDETEIIIAKHRNGPTGIIKLNFNKLYGKFTNTIN